MVYNRQCTDKKCAERHRHERNFMTENKDFPEQEKETVTENAAEKETAAESVPEETPKLFKGKKEFSEKKTKFIKDFLKYSSIIGLIATVVLIIWGVKAGIFTDQQVLADFLAKCGIWAPLVFTFIQAVQVVIPIIPGSIGCVAAVLIFGDVMGFVYNYVGIIAGSVVAFLLSKKYGYPLVRAIASKRDWDKYIKFLDNPKKFDRIFIITSAVPFTPADFLCYLAGLSSMSFLKYFIIICLAKPATILIYTYSLDFIIQFVIKLFT